MIMKVFLNLYPNVQEGDLRHFGQPVGFVRCQVLGPYCRFQPGLYRACPPALIKRRLAPQKDLSYRQPHKRSIGLLQT
jgi:hypothetical protein